MASMVNEGNGRRRIDFFMPDGSRRCLRLGQCTKADGLKVKDHIEAIIFALTHGTQLANGTAEWLGTVPDEGRFRTCRHQAVG
jgi:hypothetical protein